MKISDKLLELSIEQQKTVFMAAAELKESESKPSVGDKKLEALIYDLVTDPDFDQYRMGDELIGYYIFIDEGLLEEMIAHPDAYDTGDKLSDAGVKVSGDRIDAINEGSPLLAQEITALRNWLRAPENQDPEGGVNCGGFTVNLHDGSSVFVGFSGPSVGQGGWDAKFDCFFANTDAAARYYSQLGDAFLEI